MSAFHPHADECPNQGDCVRCGEEGGVYVEYIILVGLFGLVLAGSMLVLGEPLLKFFRHAQLVWAGPFP